MVMALLHIVLILIVLATLSHPYEYNKKEEHFKIVRTSYGPVKGKKYISKWTQKLIYSFRGIRYTAPPIGNLRFKDPVAPRRWSSVLDCTKERPACPQALGSIFLLLNPQNKTFMRRSEDCLFLNVHTPQINPDNELLPVMVYIHGGAFIEGSGSTAVNGPDFLVGEGVVLVTLNYRLGALGFLSLGIPEAPGNAGLIDQWFALRWVQREIHHFGGDPNRVTLFGESAGAAAVFIHYISPLSKGLFNLAIMQSGTALTNWAVRENGEPYALQLAKQLNCTEDGDDVPSVLSCLRSVDAEDIVSTQTMIRPLPEDIKSDAILPFIPTVDRQTRKYPILPEPPRTLMELNMGSSNAPVILGLNSEEGLLRFIREEDVKNITNNLEGFIPLKIRNNNSQEKIKHITQKIRRFYFNKTENSIKNLRGYVNLYTDVIFAYPAVVSARHFSNTTNTFLYYFTFDGRFKEKSVKAIEDKYSFPGPAHTEELSYMFVRRGVDQCAPEDSDEVRTLKRMVRMWTNFAKFGTPTPTLDPELQYTTWLPVDSRRTRYLRIDKDLIMEEKDLLAPHMALWDKVMNTFPTIYNNLSTLLDLRKVLLLLFSSANTFINKYYFS